MQSPLRADAAMAALAALALTLPAAAERPPAGRESGPPSPERFVERLDQDGDGFVSREEFDGPAEHFERLDENADGLLEASEAPTGPPPPVDLLRELDQDADGRLSVGEFEGPDGAFERLDENADGYLDGHELRPPPPPRHRRGHGDARGRERGAGGRPR